ncbi:putative nonsense-mediated mRNA decay protein [Neofusicoccum parvum]|nr:putative nonsense-mediated mRNA decay protein [Neofusicoccum parvum]
MAQPSSVPPAGANGVLPVPAQALQKNTSAPANGAPRGASHRSQQPRLKIVVRRLAPGLTQQEFEAALGDEWQLGQGKVDWFTYKAGKISKDLAKPSKPSRAYFHLTDKTHLVPLADQVRKTAFNDAKNSTRDPALIGPPSVEFAPFNRTPGGRRRHDARQGLIDQDPEFKDFLESLTNPVTKPAPGDPAAEDVAVKKEEVKTTPLIEHIREKKAAKEKPQPAKAQGKQHGRGESKDEKAASKADKKSRKGGKEEKGSKQSKAEKAGKESTPKDVKILNKGSAGKNAEPEKTDENKPAPSAPASERKRERGNASIAKQMLQRDLGIGSAAGGRRGRRDTAQEPAKTAETTAPKEPAASSPATSSPAAAAPAKAGSEARSGKKDSRPTRAERRAQKAAKANAETTTDASKPAAAPAPPTGPKILKKPQNAQQQGQKGSPAANTPASDASATAPPLKAPTGPAAQQQSPASSRPTSSRNANNNAAAAATPATSTARQAFLKHANPSQGITEPLIETALAVFGAIEKVEIDKRKGFAYVDFAEPAGLQKAIAASPVKVAEGAVQVLERKDKTPAQRAPRVPPAGAPAGPMMGGRGSGGGGGGGSGSFRGGRGGRGRGGGGGGSANAPAAAAAAAAATTAAAPAATPAAPAAKTPAPVADTPS